MTTSADLAVREEDAPALRLPALPSLPDTDSWIRAMAAIAKLADQIAHTSFVPDGLRGDPAAVTAAILTGRELGMGPMQSLRNIHVIKGVPSLKAEYKRAKVLSLGHEFKILEWDARHCKVAARRKGDRGEPTVIEYTIAEAALAGLVKRNDNYRTDPMAMLMARVTTRVTNAIFADVTNGLATTELLDDDDAFAAAVSASLALPAPPRPELGDLRQRARAQTVTATATVIPDSSPAPADTPPSGAAPTPQQSAGEDPARSPQASSPAGRDPSPQETPPPSPSSPRGSGAAAKVTVGSDSPGTVTDPQLKAIWTILGNVFRIAKDEAGKERARAVCASIAGHELKTTTLLSFNEAEKILDTLDLWRREAAEAAATPAAYLDLMTDQAGADQAGAAQDGDSGGE